MKNYWNSLNDRERNLLSLMTVVIGLYLVYLLIISPVHNRLADKKERLIHQKETLLWMKKIQTTGVKGKSLIKLSNNQLPGMVAQQLKQASLSNFPYQLEQTGTGDTQLQFDKVPFKTFLIWLEKFHEQYQVNIKQLQVEKKQAAGLVKALVVISASG